MNEPGFWGDANRARTVGKKAADLEKELVAWDSIEKELNDLETLGHMAEEEGDEAEEVRIREASVLLENTFSTLEFSTLFSGPYDAYSAIVTIQAGSGGTEAMDWAAMLMRMYLRFAETKEWGIEILDESRGEEVGYKSITLKIDGRHAYGFLRSEAGVHRLVRISPFDAEQMRHTTFAQVEVLPDIPADESEIEIPADDLRIDTYMSGGKGGQSVNTTYSAVRIVHLPTNIVVTCQNERSQQQNRETAMRVLIGKLAARKELERLAERAKLRGEYQSAEWGNQIRSYVLHPYKLVKDHRTEHETSDAEAVLNGALEPFMEAYLRKEVEESRA